VLERDRRAVDLDDVLIRKPRLAAHDVDLALLGETVETTGQLADDLVLPPA
jgi:hypothetical protein